MQYEIKITITAYDEYEIEETVYEGSFKGLTALEERLRYLESLISDHQLKAEAKAEWLAENSAEDYQDYQDNLVERDIKAQGEE